MLIIFVTWRYVVPVRFTDATAQISGSCVTTPKRNGTLSIQRLLQERRSSGLHQGPHITSRLFVEHAAKNPSHEEHTVLTAVDSAAGRMPVNIVGLGPPTLGYSKGSHAP